MSDEVKGSDRRVVYAAVLPEPFDGVSGKLVITSSINCSSKSFKAFIVPDAEDQKPIEVAVSGVYRLRDGGTTRIELNDAHNFSVQSPRRGGRLFVDGKEAERASFSKATLG